MMTVTTVSKHVSFPIYAHKCPMSIEELSA